MINRTLNRKRNAWTSQCPSQGSSWFVTFPVQLTCVLLFIPYPNSVLPMWNYVQILKLAFESIPSIPSTTPLTYWPLGSQLKSLLSGCLPWHPMWGVSSLVVLTILLIISSCIWLLFQTVNDLKLFNDTSDLYHIGIYLCFFKKE